MFHVLHWYWEGVEFAGISVDAPLACKHEDKELKRGGCLWRDTPQTKHLCYWLKQKGWSQW